MKIFLGISLSKKNYKHLEKLLKSLLLLEIPNNYTLKIIFIIENKNFHFKKIIEKTLLKKNYTILLTKFEGIPQSRNQFLKYTRNYKSKYMGFLDDDCIVARQWLKNMINFIKKTNCDVVGGPQLHKVKNDYYLSLFDLIEPKRIHGQKVDWIATNNAFLKSKILINKNLLFDEKLKNIGGSDQLFFKKLSMMNFRCRWNVTSKVIENIHANRENINWFLKRNLRYGYSGNYIDKKIYGFIIGSFLSILKIIYMLSISSTLFFLFLKKNNFYNSFFYLYRSAGRFLGLINYTPKKYI